MKYIVGALFATAFSMPGKLGKLLGKKSIHGIDSPEMANYRADADFTLDVNTCRLNAIMCCYTREYIPLTGNTKNPADNTDNCGTTRDEVFHCHGFTWSDDPDNIDGQNKQALLNYINDLDHFQKRRYFGHLPGEQKCNCVENFKTIVRRADCTTMKANGDFKACNGAQNNDLKSMYEKYDNNPTLLRMNLPNSCANKGRIARMQAAGDSWRSANGIGVPPPTSLPVSGPAPRTTPVNQPQPSQYLSQSQPQPTPSQYLSQPAYSSSASQPTFSPMDPITSSTAQIAPSSTASETLIGYGMPTVILPPGEAGSDGDAPVPTKPCDSKKQT